TKRCIVQVCKQCYTLAIPLLYEHVVLKRVECWSLVCESMASTSWIDPSIGPLGRYTKRLGVSHKRGSRVVYEGMPGLLQSLPRLHYHRF
ncbi:hypothetical protein BKA70DRAFT_1089614, partial [Coprinopsis sp. MPI-PUGE-AT-0042]